MDLAVPRTRRISVSGRAFGDHAPGGHDRDQIGQPLGFLDVVGRHDHGGAGVAQPQDERPQLLAHLGIEPDRRLVEQDQLGLVDETPARSAVGAASRLRARRRGRRLVSVSPARPSALATAESRRARGTRHSAENTASVWRTVSSMSRLLSCGTTPSPRPGQLRLGRQRVVEQPQLAGVGKRLPGEHPHRGRLARPVRPQEAEADSTRDVQVQPVDGDQRAEALDHSAQRYRGGRGVASICLGWDLVR